MNRATATDIFPARMLTLLIRPPIPSVRIMPNVCNITANNKYSI